jgi:hypothetical protein
LRQLGLRHLPSDSGNFTGGFTQRFLVVLVFGDIEEKSRLFKIGAMFFPGGDYRFERGLLAENALRFFRVIPKIRLGGNLI